MYQTKSIQSNLQNIIQQINSTKQNLEKKNLHIIEVKSNPSWAELDPVQPQIVLIHFPALKKELFQLMKCCLFIVECSFVQNY